MSTQASDDRTVNQLKARARELGVEDDSRVTRSNGHRPRKEHWVEVVQEAERDEKPSQNSIIRSGLVAGLSNREIADRVGEHYPDAYILENPAVRVGSLMYAERQRGSSWWMENREKIAEHRDIKLETPEEEQ